jgi:hypothetical protein
MGAEMACAAGPALKPEDVSALAVPRTAKPPVIDGAIGTEEWQNAAAISGPVSWENNELLPRPTTFLFSWDPGHLYFACRTYLKPGYKPLVPNGRSQGLAFVFDDGLELVFKPMGKNVTADDAGAAYKLFINTLGYVGDLTRLELGQQLKNWGPNFKTAARLTEPGTAPNGGSWWELEVSTVPQDFNLTANHQTGDEWRAMLGINHFPIFIQARIPCIGTYFESDGAGYTRLTLVDNLPAVQFTMDSVSNVVNAGIAALTLSAFNPGKSEASVLMDVNVAGAVTKKETLSVPAGKSVELVLNEKLPETATNGAIRISAKAGETTLLNYVAFFRAGSFGGMLAPQPPRDATKFAFSTVFNPVRNLLQVAGDTYYLPDPASARSMQYVVKSPSGAEITRGTLTRTAEWYYRDLVKLPPLEPGTNTVEATMTLTDGTVLGPMSATFEKRDESKEFPAWWGKKFGDPERVLPPFTAIEKCQVSGVKGQSDPGFSCWGREYAINALGLPDALRSQAEPVLAAPARIVAVVNGKEERIPLGAPTITEQKDWRVRFEGKAEGAGLAFSAKGWLEQDGLVYTEITYAPKDGRPITVDALRIEYPITDDEADGLLCIGPGNNFSSKTTMLIPKDRKGQIWSTLVTGRTGSGMTVGSFYPTVWVGNERRGFVWWADSDRGWVPDDAIPAHEAIRERGKAWGAKGMVVVLRNNLIGKPVEVAGPQTVAFSYNGTPYKPLLPGWRSWAATEDGTFFTPHRGVRMDSKTGKKVKEGHGQKNWIHPESRYPEEWAALWAEQKTNSMCLGYQGADAHARGQLPFNPCAARNGHEWGHMSFTLHGYGEKSMEGHLYRYFGSEWFDGQETWNETFTDYIVYLFDRAFREGGVHSTYWDITFPILHNNLIGGLAYQLPDGRLQRGYNGLNIRRFFMRLHAAAYDNKLLPGCNGSHSTHAYVTVAMPWLDAVLDGERNWNLDLSDRDWVDYYPLDRMRAMSVPEMWGLGICWMGNLDTTNGAKKALGKTEQSEYVWMHDSWINPYCDPGPTVMPKPVMDWGLNDTNVVYMPYWRNSLATSKDEKVLVSMWRLANEPRAIVMAYNYDRKAPRDVKIELDLKGLGMKKGDLIARDLYRSSTNETVALDAKRGALAIKGLAPHRGWVIGVAAIDPSACAKAEKALPAWGTNGVLTSAIDFGLVRPETRFHAVGQAPGIVCTNAAIQIGLWQLPDRIMLTVFNSDPKLAQDAVMKVDLSAMGLTITPWQDFLGVRTWNKVGKDPDAALDYYSQTLTVKGLKAGTGRLVAIRKY